MSKQNLDPKNDQINLKGNKKLNKGKDSNTHIPTKNITLIALLILLIKWILDKIFVKDKEKQSVLELNGNKLEIRTPENEKYESVKIVKLPSFFKKNRNDVEKLNNLVETNQTSLKSTYALDTKPNNLFQLSELVLTLKQNNTNDSQIENEIAKYEKTHGKLPDGFKNDLTTYIKNKNNLENPEIFKNLNKLGEQRAKLETTLKSEGIIPGQQPNPIAQQANSTRGPNSIQPKIASNQPTPEQQAVLHHTVQIHAQQKQAPMTAEKENSVGNQEWMKVAAAVAITAAVANGPGK